MLFPSKVPNRCTFKPLQPSPSASHSRMAILVISAFIVGLPGNSFPSLPPTPSHSCLTLHFQNSSTDGCADLIFTFPFALFNLLVKLHVWANCDSICCLHWFAISGLGICHCLQRFTDEPQFTNDSYINSRELTCCADFTLGRHIKVFHLDKVQKTVHSVSK